jgi:hypothetical protein
MLRTAEYYRTRNRGALNFVFTNVEIDRRLFVYGLMNAILHRIPAIWIHGDSIRVEAWAAFAVIPEGGHCRWEPVPLEKAETLIAGVNEFRAAGQITLSGKGVQA